MDHQAISNSVQGKYYGVITSGLATPVPPKPPCPAHSVFGEDYQARKNIPVLDGFLMYFPKAVVAVTEVSVNGNNQHNPGERLHWARGKSMDQMNTAVRHIMDHQGGMRYDYRWDQKTNTWVRDGRTLAKAAWRIMAAIELDIEAEQASVVQSGTLSINV